MKRGKLIVFEGISGTGKETQAKLLQRFLRINGITSRIVFHPSPDVKPELRKARTIEEQIAILARDRSYVVHHTIRPALNNGEWIISLRNYISAMVYQADSGKVKKIDIQPDYLFYFDISPEIAMERIISRGETRGKYEKIKLLEQKRKKYQDVLKHIPHVTIDASHSITSIQSTIYTHINVLTR